MKPSTAAIPVDRAEASRLAGYWNLRNLRDATTPELQEAHQSLRRCGVRDLPTCYVPGKALLRQLDAELSRRATKAAAEQARHQRPQGPYSRALWSVTPVPPTRFENR